jgi:hypothetical protein
MSRVGDETCRNSDPARSGRPPRETTANVSRGTGTRPKISSHQVSGLIELFGPLARRHETFGKKPDVESQLPCPLVDLLLIAGEQIEE